MAVGWGQARAGGWQALHQKHNRVSRGFVAAKMRVDGIKRPGLLTRYRYLVRLTISDTGGGSASHSEVAVRFRTLPKRVLARGWSDRPERNRAQLGAYARCKFPRRKGSVRPVGRACSVKYNGKGFVDVTKGFTDRNILFVHDPGTAWQGNSVVWFAASKPQRNMWYYVLPGARGTKFGFGKIEARKYEIEPGSAPRPGRPGPGLPPTPHTPRVVPSKPPAKATWQKVMTTHRRVGRQALERKMAADGVPSPGYLMTLPYVVRLAVLDTGSGSASYSELEVRFRTRPKKALGKAWADRTDISRAQLGAAGACRKRKSRKGPGRKARTCPMHFNGIGWRNVVSAFKSKRMVIINNPNNAKQAGTILWLAFDRPQSLITWRAILPRTYPTFGVGRVSVEKFSLVAAAGGPTPGPGRPPAPRPGTGTLKPPSFGTGPAKGRRWKSMAATARTVNRWQLAGVIRRDGLVGGAYLQRFTHLVRISLTNTGGGSGRRSEVVMRFGAPIALALGKAWADRHEMGRAQIGPPKSCRTGLYRNLPAGWRTCPVHFNNLGWRNLTRGLANKKLVLFINQPARAYKGHTVVWFGFRKDPGAVRVYHYKRAGRYTLGTGRLNVTRIKVTQARVRPPSTTPPPSGEPAPDRPPPDGSFPPVW